MLETSRPRHMNTKERNGTEKGQHGHPQEAISQDSPKSVTRHRSLSGQVNRFCWTPDYMQQGKQVLVNNSRSVIFSAFWFLIGTKCSIEKTFWKLSFWERKLKQATVAGSGFIPGAGAASDSRFQV